MNDSVRSPLEEITHALTLLQISGASKWPLQDVTPWPIVQAIGNLERAKRGLQRAALADGGMWIRICRLCADGAGGECHSPECALYMNRAPDVPPFVEEKGTASAAL